MTRISGFGEAEFAAHQAKVRPAAMRASTHKPSKYHNVKTVVGGIKFDSKREAAQDAELVLRERAGEISDLQRQVKFSFALNGVKIGSYIADWTYIENGQEIVRDCKGVRTPVYRLKKRLMRAWYGLEITES